MTPDLTHGRAPRAPRAARAPLAARSRGSRARAALGAGAVAAALLAAACSSVLDVDNPNNVSADQLELPVSAPSQVNGTLAAITRGITQLLGHVTTASDEFSWSGSLDGMNQLNRGIVRDPFNEFLEDGARGLTPARYMAARTVKQLEAFRAAGTLADPLLLARANLYAAVVYDFIANSYDDFVIASDQRTSGAPVGAANMVALYDSVEAAVARALPLAPASAASNAELRGQLFAMQARARFDRAVWRKLNPSGRAPADPLVNDAGAAAAADSALRYFGRGNDARLRLAVQQNMGFGNCFLPTCTNSRREIRFNPALATYNYTTRVLTVALRDPIANQPDPALTALIGEFITGDLLTAHTITGTRDMLLIVAEVALANGNTQEFARNINDLRAFHQLPPWTGAAGQPSARDMLVYSRRVNLYLQGRRLNDMYRFGVVDSEWAATSDAATCPGSLFPIPNSERLANDAAAASPATCGR